MSWRELERIPHFWLVFDNRNHYHHHHPSFEWKVRTHGGHPFRGDRGRIFLGFGLHRTQCLCMLLWWATSFLPLKILIHNSDKSCLFCFQGGYTRSRRRRSQSSRTFSNVAASFFHGPASLHDTPLTGSTRTRSRGIKNEDVEVLLLVSNNKLWLVLS